MTKIINFPTNKPRQLSAELRELTAVIGSRINDELKHPDLSIQGNLNDPEFVGSLTEKLSTYRDEWAEITMKATLIAVEETIRSELKEFK